MTARKHELALAVLTALGNRSGSAKVSNIMNDDEVRINTGDGRTGDSKGGSAQDGGIRDGLDEYYIALLRHAVPDEAVADSVRRPSPGHLCHRGWEPPAC